jgi:cell division transport system permease protein
VIAYLKKGISIKNTEDLLDHIRSLDGVESVRYFSPSDALAFLQAKLGAERNLLEGIQPSVLPASVEIQLKREYRRANQIRTLAERLKQFPQFEEIQYGREWVETFSTLVDILQITCWILGGVLLGAMILIISNTLQLTIASRREEIEIMQFVGASPLYIRVPFYMEGILQGLLGAAIAVGLLFLLHRVVLLYIPSSIQVWLARVSFLFLPAEFIAGILVGGMVLGFLGSILSSARLLRYRW